MKKLAASFIFWTAVCLATTQMLFFAEMYRPVELVGTWWIFNGQATIRYTVYFCVISFVFSYIVMSFRTGISNKVVSYLLFLTVGGIIAHYVIPEPVMCFISCKKGWAIDWSWYVTLVSYASIWAALGFGSAHFNHAQRSANYIRRIFNYGELN